MYVAVRDDVDVFVFVLHVRESPVNVRRSLCVS